MHELVVKRKGDLNGCDRAKVQCVHEQAGHASQPEQADGDKLEGDHDQDPVLQADTQICAVRLKYLDSYPSNTDRFLEPVRGELRYPDVFTSGGTTLRNVEPYGSGLKKAARSKLQCKG